MCVGLSERFKEYKEYKLHKKVPGEKRFKREDRREEEKID
jgi:hypothetical protein